MTKLSNCQSRQNVVVKAALYVRAEVKLCPYLLQFSFRLGKTFRANSTGNISSQVSSLVKFGTVQAVLYLAA
jgi:hypothetical protein